MPCLTIKVAIHGPHRVEGIDVRRDRFGELLLRLMLQGLKLVDAEARQLLTLLLYDGTCGGLRYPRQLAVVQSVV